MTTKILGSVLATSAALLAAGVLFATTAVGAPANAVATGPGPWVNSHKYHGDDPADWLADPDAVPADPDGEDGFDNPANLTQIGDRVHGTREQVTTSEVTRYQKLRWTRGNTATYPPTGPDGDGYGWKVDGKPGELPAGMEANTILADRDHPGAYNYVYFWPVAVEVEKVETVDVYTWWVQIREAWDWETGEGGNGSDRGDGEDADDSAGVGSGGGAAAGTGPDRDQSGPRTSPDRGPRAGGDERPRVPTEIDAGR